MKIFFALLYISFLSTILFAQDSVNKISIIPQPVNLIENQGTFSLPQNIIIEAISQPEMKQTIAFLKDRLTTPTGNSVTIKSNDPSATVQLLLNKKADNILGKEGYNLSVTPTKIVIKANNAAGLFYGVQTLIQLFPKEIESASLVNNVKWQAPCVTITDYPRFGWRGLMFDVSRHFFTKSDVEKYIHQMVRYKFNLLHLHLTDDEGWRIEIKSLPKLTEVGAYNVKKKGIFRNFFSPC